MFKRGSDWLGFEKIEITQDIGKADVHPIFPI